MEEDINNEEGKKKRGGSLVLIIVIFLFVLLLVVIGAIGYLVVSGPSDENTATPAAAQTSTPSKSANTSTNKNAGAQRGSDYANIGPMFPLQPFTLNLLSDGGARYVKCTIQLEENTELLQPELEKKTAIIRDIIIRSLTSKTFEEVSTAKGKERLKDELVGKINEVLTDGFIKNIYFTDFVVQ